MNKRRCTGVGRGQEENGWDGKARGGIEEGRGKLLSGASEARKETQSQR